MNVITVTKDKIIVRIPHQFYKEYDRENHVLLIDNEFFKIRKVKSSDVVFMTNRVNFVYLNEEND